MKQHIIVAMLILIGSAITHAEPLDYSLDYSNDALWLCSPDNPNTCDTDLSTTVVAATGKLRKERHRNARRPEIDCFYVYPTVSNDPGGNSDTEISPEEKSVIQAQFARFGSVCRTFAPLYRQVTLTALRSRFTNNPVPSDFAMAYEDVKAAWNHYLEHDNEGRGVALIGHSQGSGMLTSLVTQEIEGKPIQKQILSAMLIGTSNIKVPRGKDVGGTFKHMPLCREATQTQCIVTFASFRSDVPPPENTLFGKPRDGKGISACNNPAALAGGKTFLNPYLSADTSSIAQTASSPEGTAWTTKGKVDSAFVKVPGLISGECVSRDGLNYLEVTVNSDVNDPRADQIQGDVQIGGQVVESWGLHLIDMHLGMGDMIQLVETQGQAYLNR